MVKSQYFDALDTIVEVHEDEEEVVDSNKKEEITVKKPNSDDEWEDVVDAKEEGPDVLQSEKVYKQQTSSSISGSRREIILNQVVTGGGPFSLRDSTM